MARSKAGKGSHGEIRQLVRRAEDAGFRVEQTNGGHLVFYPPTDEHPPIYAASTPSDHRAIKNVTAMLVRAGLPKAA